MSGTRKAPLPVRLAAAVCGVYGVLQAVAALTMVDLRRGNSLLVGLAIAAVFLVLMWGLWRGHRWALVLSVIAGVLLVAAGIAVLPDRFGALFFLIAGALLILLVTVPRRSREHLWWHDESRARRRGRWWRFSCRRHATDR